MNLENFYKKYEDKIYKYVYKRVSNKSDVDDIVQDIILKLKDNLDLYDETKSDFLTFVFNNANQVIIDYYRKNVSRESRNETLEDKDYKSDYKYFESVDEEYGLNKIIKKLPEMQRKVIEFIYIEGLSYKECGNLIGKSESSVKSLLFRAKNNLKKIIEEENPEILDQYFGRLIKIIVVSLVSVCMVTGLTYAIIKFYNVMKEKETYTINELRQEVPEDLVEVSRVDALEFIKKYDNIILEKDINYTENDLKLVKNYKLDKVCWTYQCDDYLIYIDANTGEFLEYSFKKENDFFETLNIEEKLKQLTNFEDYNLYYENEMGDYTEIVYCMKYDKLYNVYQNITVNHSGDFLAIISVLKCDYEDKEIKISQDEALNRIRAMGEEPVKAVLAIENVINEKDIKMENEIEIVSDTCDEINMTATNYKILKVWKIDTLSGKWFYMDVNTGEVYYKNTYYEEMSEEKKE